MGEARRRDQNREKKKRREFFSDAKGSYTRKGQKGHPKVFVNKKGNDDNNKRPKRTFLRSWISICLG